MLFSFTSTWCTDHTQSKIKEVPRNILSAKVWKIVAGFGKISAYASLKTRTELGVQKGKRSLLACHTRYKYSMETSRSSVKVRLSIKVRNFSDIW